MMFADKLKLCTPNNMKLALQIVLESVLATLILYITLLRLSGKHKGVTNFKSRL